MKGFGSAAVAILIIIFFIIIAKIAILYPIIKPNSSVRYLKLEKVIREQDYLQKFGENYIKIYCNGLLNTTIKSNLTQGIGCEVSFENLTSKNCIFDALSKEKEFFSREEINSQNLEEEMEKLKSEMSNKGYVCKYVVKNQGISECPSLKSFEFECELGDVETSSGIKTQRLRTKGGTS